MFSVICPTMWRGAQLAIMLPSILAMKSVGEIIIIDNANVVRPSGFNQFLNHPKLKVIDKGTNTYVNPAWNLGVESAQFEQICLLSDDVLFDPTLFDQLEPLTTKDVGVIGVAHDTLKKERSIKEQKITCGLPVKLRAVTHHMPLLCWGILMFMHKDNYSPIDARFKIFYGDNWLAAANKKAGRTNYYMDGIQICTQMTTTSSQDVFKPIGAEETDKAEGIFDEIFGVGSYRQEKVYDDMEQILLKDYKEKHNYFVALKT
jgi:hypothetical protein